MRSSSGQLAGVAQLEAQAICNRQVVGSSPTAGSPESCSAARAKELAPRRQSAIEAAGARARCLGVAARNLENASWLFGFLVVIDHHHVIDLDRRKLLDLVPDVLGVWNGLVAAVLTPDDGVMDLALTPSRIGL